MTPSTKSRSGSSSQNAGWCIEFSYSRKLNGTPHLHLRLEILPVLLAVCFATAVDLGFGVVLDEIQQVSARLAILEQDQKRHRQHRHHVLQEDIHGDAPHLSVQEPAEDVGERRQA